MKIPNSPNTTRIMSELAKHADGDMDLVYHAMNIALKRYKADIHPDSVKNIIDELRKEKTMTTKNLDRQQILEKLFKHNGFCMIHEETNNDTASYNVKNIIGLFLDDMLAKGYHVKAIDGHNDKFVRFYKDVDEDSSQSKKTVYKYESSCSKENAENYINNDIEKCKNCCQDKEMGINLNDK